MTDHPTRGTARSTRAMIATPDALATSAGLDVLRRGGNAVDAAIAANGVLSVTYPASCGLGGDAMWLVYEPAAQTVHAYNGSGRSPRESDAETLRARWKKLPDRAAQCVTVPGVVRSWEDVGRRHGTRDLGELLAPAEQYARDGFACTDVVAAQFDRNAWLRSRAEAVRWFFARGVPRPGDVIRNPDLAKTIGEIRDNGADEFYGGRFGHTFVKTLRALGSTMTINDLANHRTDEDPPLRLRWRDLDLVAQPPNSQGAVTLMAMNILSDDAELDDLNWHHVAIESIKRALYQRDRFFCDPQTLNVPVAQFLAPAWGKATRSAISLDRSWFPQAALDRGDTVAICAVDGEGRAVSLIQSLYMNFGTGYVAEGTGVFLHNRGAYFSLEPGHPNEYAGGKRPLHTLSPAMVLRDGKPILVHGTMGGDGQPQTQVQLLHNIFERGMDVQEAIDAPRWNYGRSSEEQFTPTVHLESRFPESVRKGLTLKGHHVALLGPFEHQMGHAQAIAIDDKKGTLSGGADPRADSAALGL